MAQKISQGNIFGRIGTGIGQGMAEQIPKEIERNRLASGLKNLSQKKDLSPFEQFSELVGIPGAADRPQVIQTAGDLLRQQAIINSSGRGQNQPMPPPQPASMQQPGQQQSATTVESTDAALKPYIPPSGQEQEMMARQLMAAEPQVYRDIESARGAVAQRVGADLQRSNALLGRREAEQAVQNESERKLQEEIKTLGAHVPGTVLSRLQRDAVKAVKDKKMSADEAKVKFGAEADSISRDFENMKSWGDIGLLSKSSTDVLSSISSLQKKAKKGGFQKDAAEQMIADVGVTPYFAYASFYPVSDKPKLNDTIKQLQDITPLIDKYTSFGQLQGMVPGVASSAYQSYKKSKSGPATSEIVPQLAELMGHDGSPLSIAYELEKRGYDPEIWKEYLVENQDNLNLTMHQLDELQKPKPAYYGSMNDWWLKSFSGVK